MEKRLRGIGLESTVSRRREYREILFTTAGIGEFISGVILFDETIRQQASDGTAFCEILAGQGVIPGIKVDKGTTPLAGLAGDKVTEGLDGLRSRLAEYAAIGARFAKWRAVITVGEQQPSSACIEANAHALARYAALCQEAGLVPFVEPEVLMDGSHSLQRCAEVTAATIAVLRQTVPAAVPGIVFLSGGQSDTDATARLDALNRRAPSLGS